ncbi:ABC transporter atnG [Colletotrichum viniferum]|nr:ABC transporter atnG [Colletotrichum viniferum]
MAKIRGLLVAAVYQKLTTVATARHENAAVTLMSTDVERVTQGLRVFHEAWANVVEVGIAVWFLQRELHTGSIAPVAIAIACFLVTLCVNKFTMPRQNRWMEALQARINRTVSIISQIKSIKMLGLGEQSEKALDALRVQELELANGFRMIMVFSFCIAFAPIFIVPVVCFAIYLSASPNGSVDNTFDVAKAFTSLSLVVILTQPLSSLFQYVPMFAGAANCLQRINDFIHSPSHRDRRERKSDVTRKRGGPRDDASGAEKSTAVVDIVERNPAVEDVLSIYDGAFGWSENRWDLHDVNISIPKSQLTVITGPVASGKSTLCKAFLGEVPYVKGIVKISSGAGIGFCDQTPYLTNTTIYENIIGGSVVDNVWYKTVIRAVDLETDFGRLSSGDRALAGNNGDALSTGQKQRVAIARAVYAKKPLIILDDVFSGMDNVTKAYIYEQLLRPKGLLRLLGTMVILACSDRDLCLAADFVVELIPGGPPVSIHPARRAESNYHAEGQRKVDGISTTTDSPDTIHDKTNQSATSAATQKQAPKTPSDWATYGYFARVVGSPNTALLIFLGGVFGTLYTFPSVWVNWWTTDPTAQDSFYLGIYALLQATGLICWFLFTRHCLTTVVSRSGKKLHHILLSTVMSASFPYLSAKESGTIINRFSQDLQSVDGELPAALLNTVATAFIALAQVALVATASPWLTISYPFLVLVFYGIQRFYLRTSQQLRPLDLELKSPLYTHFLDTLRGITTVRAFGWSQQYVERNQQLLDASQRPNYLLQMIQQWLSLVLNMVVVVIVTLLVTLSLKLQSSLGLTAVALVNLMSLSQMLRSVVIGWTLMETSITAVARIREFEQTTPRENDGKSEGAIVHGPVSGKIEYKNLTVSYGLSNENLALKNVNLVIEAGQKVGICGRSGSGKSSLIASLFRLLDVREGKLVIDANDISDYSVSTLRSSINAIPQDPFITSGTFREVIDPYKSSSDAAIEEALRKVNLFEHVQNNGGLDGNVAPEALSQGQKQLLSLARAIMRRWRIVVLDEVTSSLDLETEQLIWRVLQEEFRGCTIIAIAHRLETIIGFDRVAVMDEGSIIEFDDPLAKDRQSALRELWRIKTYQHRLWIWPVPLFIGAYFAPEFPWNAVRRGKFDTARESLVRLREDTTEREAEVDAPLAYIRHTTALEEAKTHGASFIECFKGTNLWRTEVILRENCVVWAAQILGANALVAYGVTFLQAAGFSEIQSLNLNISLSACYVIGGIICWFLFPHIVRATLYMSGLTFLFFCNIVIGGLGFTKDAKAQIAVGVILVVSTLVNMVTVGPVCYPIVAETPSGRLRIVEHTLNPRMISPIGWNWRAKAGFFYAGTNLVCNTWCYFRLPETKDRTFGELDILFENKIPARKFKYTTVDQFAGRNEIVGKEEDMA